MNMIDLANNRFKGSTLLDIGKEENLMQVVLANNKFFRALSPSSLPSALEWEEDLDEVDLVEEEDKEWEVDEE
ncbi:hypothetical protein ACLOJK_027885 [Asimina triloba]